MRDSTRERHTPPPEKTQKKTQNKNKTSTRPYKRRHLKPIHSSLKGMTCSQVPSSLPSKVSSNTHTYTHTRTCANTYVVTLQYRKHTPLQTARSPYLKTFLRLFSGEGAVGLLLRQRQGHLLHFTRELEQVPVFFQVAGGVSIVKKGTHERGQGTTRTLA